ncbi:hypothetical protein O6H91_01G049300 [Diphasiastrum complanatum]|uniref:Uncharacterized protein n=1 Tax=Diphasiastrum complanatum TaxID=34168 RepID=A0ACC2ER05_DIPCM|nr:hypothetical protein O6H91_01G049300 [Diphasiastrum complanatum]
MENHYVLDVDRLCDCPSAVDSSRDIQSSLVEEQGIPTSTAHIVSFDLGDDLQKEALCENEHCDNEICENELKSSEIGIRGVKSGKANLPAGLPECRICQDEDEEENLESPCACSGSLKYAHRKCVQRWCNEKGNTICEICNQPYQNGYAAPPRPDATNEPSVAWGLPDIHQLNLRDQQILSMAAAERHMLEAEYNNFSATNASGTTCCRSAALILMALLLLRHALSMAAVGSDEDAATFFTLFLLRAAGFLLPCYIMARALDILQRRRQRQEAALAAAEVALILRAAQARGVHFSVAPGPVTAL